MTTSERWETPADLTAARERLASAIPGWTPPLAYGVAFVPSTDAEIGPEHFPVVGGTTQRLAAVALASVLGHSGGTAVYDLTREQLDRAIEALEPAEASAASGHPNLRHWRDVVRPAWQADPQGRVIAVFVGIAGNEDPAVAALRAAVGRPLTWRERLRALATIHPPFPPFHVEAAPTDPRELFEDWMDAAIATGVPAPHALTLSTVGPAGEVTGRTLVLKDVDDRGWWFATRTESIKGFDLASNPQAAMTFFWSTLGRQVRVAGPVEYAGRDASAADFLSRPADSRAAAMIGAQGAPLSSRAEYLSAFGAATEATTVDPSMTATNWDAMILRPLWIEFWAVTDSEGQIRLEYHRESPTAPWSKGLLWP